MFIQSKFHLRNVLSMKCLISCDYLINQIIFYFIGYGHSTPATKLGKVFTISYACLGIPIAMIMFQVYYYCYLYWYYYYYIIIIIIIIIIIFIIVIILIIIIIIIIINLIIDQWYYIMIFKKSLWYSGTHKTKEYKCDIKPVWCILYIHKVKWVCANLQFQCFIFIRLSKSIIRN